MISKKILFVLSFAISISALADSNFTDEQLEELLKVKIRSVSSFSLDPTLINAVREQNTQNLSREIVERRDEEWKNSKGLTPFKYSLQTNRAGRFLKTHVESNLAFNEAFLTDNQGANVAAFPITSDYWQGDEEKWTASFNKGNGKLYIGPLEKDESTNTEAIQISSPILDMDGKTIGVLVVGVNLTYLKNRAQNQ